MVCYLCYKQRYQPELTELERRKAQLKKLAVEAKDEVLSRPNQPTVESNESPC